MAEHRAFTVATDIDVYFADPGAPWQRGSNENTNGLLRQYFPRSVDLARYSATELRAVADELNGRPRKALDWATPAERLAALLEASWDRPLRRLLESKPGKESSTCARSRTCGPTGSSATPWLIGWSPRWPSPPWSPPSPDGAARSP